MEVQSGDLVHELVSHVGPTVLLVLVFAGFLILYVRSLRAAKRERGRLPEVEGLNRRDRREMRVMNRRKRHGPDSNEKKRAQSRRQ